MGRRPKPRQTFLKERLDQRTFRQANKNQNKGNLPKQRLPFSIDRFGKSLLESAENLFFKKGSLRVPQSPHSPVPQRCQDGGDVVGGVVVIFAGEGATAGDIAEHLPPTVVVVEVLAEVVVVVVGVEDEFLVGVDDAVSVGVEAGIDDACRAAGDLGAVVVRFHGIVRVAIGAGGADVDLIVLQITAASADAGKFGFVGVAVGVAAEFGVVAPQIFPPDAVGRVGVLLGGVVGGYVPEGVEVGCNFLQGDVAAAAVNAEHLVSVRIHHHIGVVIGKIGQAVADILAVLHGAVGVDVRLLIHKEQVPRQLPARRAFDGFLVRGGRLVPRRGAEFFGNRLAGFGFGGGFGVGGIRIGRPTWRAGGVGFGQSLHHRHQRDGVPITVGDGHHGTSHRLRRQKSETADRHGGAGHAPIQEVCIGLGGIGGQLQCLADGQRDRCAVFNDEGVRISLGFVRRCPLG